MSGYYDLPWEGRLAIMRALESVQCAMVGGRDSGFCAAIGRDRFGDAVVAMAARGFKCTDLITFPLGSDRPPDHLRHDSTRYNVPRCNWLYATFAPAS